MPIRRANEKISAITSSKLHMRLDANDVPVELEATVTSFNAMLGRIEDGYAQLANVSADIAHELRTPVTNLITQTEVAVGQARSAEEYREISDRKSTRLNSSHVAISYAVFCLK